MNYAGSLKRQSVNGDGGLQVDHMHIRRGLDECIEGISPDISGIHGFRDGTMHGFGHFHIAPGRLYIRFVEARIAWVRQHLINASSDHHITA